MSCCDMLEININLEPVSFPLFHSQCTRHPLVSLEVILSKSKATGSHLDLPKDIVEHVRKSKFTRLLLRGPSGGETSCKLLIQDEPKMSTKIGKGWKTFCKENKLKLGNRIKLEFRNLQLNNVDYVLCRSLNYISYFAR